MTKKSARSFVTGAALKLGAGHCYVDAALRNVDPPILLGDKNYAK
jgi:hypothetical protein